VLAESGRRKGQISGDPTILFCYTFVVSFSGDIRSDQRGLGLSAVQANNESFTEDLIRVPSLARATKEQVHAASAA
jgi:hypothetical protein